MLKNILNLEGAQQLSNNEQKEINGGKPAPSCQEGGYATDRNSCLCKNGGVINMGAFQCSNGQNTGRYYEEATHCCYDFMNQ